MSATSTNSTQTASATKYTPPLILQYFDQDKEDLMRALGQMATRASELKEAIRLSAFPDVQVARKWLLLDASKGYVEGLVRESLAVAQAPDPPDPPKEIPPVQGQCPPIYTINEEATWCILND